MKVHVLECRWMNNNTGELEQVFMGVFSTKREIIKYIRSCSDSACSYVATQETIDDPSATLPKLTYYNEDGTEI